MGKRDKFCVSGQVCVLNYATGVDIKHYTQAVQRLYEEVTNELA